MIKFLSCFFVFIFCFTIYSIPEQIAYEVTDIGTSAGLLSRGRVGGFSDDYSVVYENPAGMHRMKRFGVSNFFTSTLGGQVQFYNLVVGKPFSFGHLAVSYMAVVVPDVPYTQMEVGWPIVVDRFDYKDSLLKLSFSRSYRFFWYGGSFNYYKYRMYTYTGHGQNFDFGVLFKKNPFEVSLMGKNLFPFLKMKYNNNKELSLSSSCVLSSKLTLYFLEFYSQIDYHFLKKSLLTSGAVQFKPSFIPFFTLSAGVSESKPLHKKFRNYYLGTGLRIFDLKFDFAYQKTDYFLQNDQYYFSIHLVGL